MLQKVGLHMVGHMAVQNLKNLFADQTIESGEGPLSPQLDTAKALRSSSSKLRSFSSWMMRLASLWT